MSARLLLADNEAPPAIDGETLDGLFTAFSVSLEHDPLAEKMETLEAAIAGYSGRKAMIDDLLSLFAASEDKAEPIPPAVMAMYRLAEYYFDNDGDLYQTVETPIMVGAQDFVIEHQSEAVTKTWTDIYEA